MRFTMSCAGETIPSHHQPNLPDPQRKGIHPRRINPIASRQPAQSAWPQQNDIQELNATSSGDTSTRGGVAKRVTEFSPRLGRKLVNSTENSVADRSTKSDINSAASINRHTLAATQ